MADDATPRSSRPVQAAALALIVRRLSRAGEAPWLHGEVARRMAERLPLIRLQPRTAIDWWSHLGGTGGLLTQAYPQAKLLRVESEGELLPPSRADATRSWWPWRRPATAPARIAADQLPVGGADLLWANMTLHLCPDPVQQLQQWHRALAPEGFLMFSTLGPGSLTGLSRLYAAANWPVAFAPFVDMHDLGDMLVQAGFAEPVMDQERLTLTWPDAGALLRELRSLGGNADAGRAAGLRTPRWRQRLEQAMDGLRGPDGRLRLDFELVYGHAFRVAPKPRVTAQTSVALDDMRAMIRAGRRPSGPS
jgi:malonyl-CoA O-methyltransferase